MNKRPEIRGPGDESDFHDSSLLHFAYDPTADKAVAVVSTPDADDTQRIWQLEMLGVLRIEMETLGDGEPPISAAPPEVYDIYRDVESEEHKRWTERLRNLGIDGDVLHLVFASSFLRGWGEREYLEGIHVVCRRLRVVEAAAEFSGSPSPGR